MKISYNWLREFIQSELEAEELGKLLTNAGLEVESVEEYESIKGSLNGLITAEVKTCKQHPNADRLKVTTVSTGSGPEIQVVCGAPNVAEGQKVILAQVGATLYPQGSEPFQIGKSKIRGELSEGMLCAEDEIGLGTSHAGIIVLDPDTLLGKPASEIFPVYQDHVFEIGLTPNRGDAASHLGVARDLKAILKTDLKYPSIKDFPKDESNEFKVNIESKGCLRYSGMLIRGVKVTESPAWIKNRLKAIGINPINNIVDATNYVLHELGQPLHAFDAEKIKGKRIVIKESLNGQNIFTLDKTERKLNGQELLIWNESEPMALAGVFGGLDSGITSVTKDIFLESAFFDPGAVRKTAKLHGLSTDASFRFERGTDIDMTVIALKRVAEIILDIAGGTSAGIIDEYPQTKEKNIVNLTWKGLNRLIGQEIPKDEVKEILKNLDFKISSENENVLSLEVPFAKTDVEREVDVVEEVLRIYGYNKIQIPTSVHSALAFSNQDQVELFRNKISDYLSSIGFNEIITNTLTKISYFKEEEILSAVRIINPLSSDLEMMRNTMVYSVLESLQYNRNRKKSDLKFFEIGRTYSKSGNEYQEQEHLVLALTGRKESESWNSSDAESNYYFIKSLVGNILAKAGANSYSFEISSENFYDQCVTIKDKGSNVLSFGILSQKLCKNFDITSPVMFADFDFTWLQSIQKNKKIIFKALPKFPEVRRDLSILIDKNIQFQQIKSSAEQSGGKLITGINVFDVYQGEKIPQGKKSYSISFLLQDPEKTLTDEVIDRAMQKIIKGLNESVGAEIR